MTKFISSDKKHLQKQLFHLNFRHHIALSKLFNATIISQQQKRKHQVIDVLYSLLRFNTLFRLDVSF